MTKEKAHRQAEAVAMGITFYVVQRPEGDFLPVQEPPDDCEIVATLTPPGSVHESAFDRE